MKTINIDTKITDSISFRLNHLRTMMLISDKLPWSTVVDIEARIDELTTLLNFIKGIKDE